MRYYLTEVVQSSGLSDRMSRVQILANGHPLLFNGENMWESSGEGYVTQPNSPYRDTPSQPNVCDGLIHKESEPSNEKDDSDRK